MLPNASLHNFSACSCGVTLCVYSQTLLVLGALINSRMPVQLAFFIPGLWKVVCHAVITQGLRVTVMVNMQKIPEPPPLFNKKNQSRLRLLSW